MKLRFDEGSVGAWFSLDGGVGEAGEDLVEFVASVEAVFSRYTRVLAPILSSRMYFW